MVLLVADACSSQPDTLERMRVWLLASSCLFSPAFPCFTLLQPPVIVQAGVDGECAQLPLPGPVAGHAQLGTDVHAMRTLNLIPPWNVTRPDCMSFRLLIYALTGCTLPDPLYVALFGLLLRSLRVPVHSSRSNPKACNLIGLRILHIVDMWI